MEGCTKVKGSLILDPLGSQKRDRVPDGMGGGGGGLAAPGGGGNGLGGGETL